MEIIQKCGLDAYFFLRYLQTLLIIFVPLACVILPILLPINCIGGRSSQSNDLLSTNLAARALGDNSQNVTNNLPHGLDTLSWGNVSETQTHRYWAHLVLAVLVVIWVCYVFFAELRVYILVRQDYLTSAEHRLRASATTVLVSAIPQKWLTVDALSGLFDVFPGGIRNIWINRNYDPLLAKVREREDVVAKLEAAETELIRMCKKVQLKQQKKEQKEAAKRKGAKGPTKEDREKQQEMADAEAARIAQGEGTTAGDLHQVHHTVDEAVDDDDRNQADEDVDGEFEKSKFKIPIIGGGLKAMGRGLDRTLDAVGDSFGKAGQTVFQGAKNVVGEVDNTVETTNGFKRISAQPDEKLTRLDTASTVVSERSNGRQKKFGVYFDGTADVPPRNAPPQDVKFGESPAISEAPGFGERRKNAPPNLQNIKYSFGDVEDQNNSWWKFWKGPSGGFPSPLPNGYEEDQFEKKNFGQITLSIPQTIWRMVMSLFTTNEGPQHEYPPHSNPDYKEDSDAMWEKYIKKGDRPSHRLKKLGIPLLPAMIPFLNKKVDTIYWCREELARLNNEIEYDQAHAEDYPVMNSAFIQFNHQVAAHMAAQAVAHHIPKHMTPRMVEISPTDVIWDNMSIKWWEVWLKTGVTIAIVAGMIILWAIPVSASALLGNIPQLIENYKQLEFLKVAEPALKPLAGILPALVLAILMILPPIIFYMLATKQGLQTGKQRELSVQNFYFFFLFVQVFLVVSIASGTINTLATIKDITSIPGLLAQNLPKASNYFFSYMIIQALSVSAGNLLQLSALIMWFIMPKLFDNTARQKWRRNTTLPTVSWGSYFPVYTNFACIALVYSVVAPLIMVFAIITFTLLWIANRYSMLYVYRHTEDTGGLLYPRAINQTFTGLYVMELCLIGLFFLVRDVGGNVVCTPQAVIMIVVLVLTAMFQILLNQSFGPLYNHLPITLEDDAVLRDEAFERAQAERFKDDNEALDDLEEPVSPDGRHDDDIELRKLRRSSTQPEKTHTSRFNPRHGLRTGATWAARGARGLGAVTFGNPDKVIKHNRRRKDIEAQKLMGEALFGGYNDEIEDLTPEERDVLVKAAFQHEALRARRPNVWLPRDDLGVSDDEVRRTELFSDGKIWITNRGTALDSKVRVLYGKNPPDFSEVDLIML
jgi:hypothetical protein